MRICSYQECAAWCAAHGYATCCYPGNSAIIIPDLTEPDFRFAMFSVPSDANRRVALVKNLMELLPPDIELFLQIDDWSVWPSGQHMPLFKRFRQAVGETRPLIEAPGHVIEKGDREDAVSLLVVSVLFSWNCHVLSAGGDQALFVSHDEWGWFTVKDPKSLPQVIDLLRRFNVYTNASAH